MQETKYCGDCGTDLLLVDFYHGDSYCKRHRKARNNVSRQGNLKRVYLLNRLRKYNLTELDFQMLLDRAGGSCELCGKAFDKEPQIEHNHVTGKVRGLVCRRCNYLIWAAEDPLMEAAVSWARKNGP